ncbi:MAG: choice-of-anchor B family protein [Bacteroidetes bacterium]|nr:choice-of-anchor B family protein [Bacteroidota bacterium]
MKKIFYLIGLILCSTIAHSQKNITQLANINYGYQLAGCWHYVDSTGHEFAIVGTYHGVSIIDMANPANPIIVDSTPGTPSIWREVKVWGKYAYVSTEGYDTTGVLNGIQIIDLSNLPGPVTYKFYKGDGAIANQLTRAHTVTVDNGYLYISGSQLFGGGILICGLNDPWNPEYVSSYSNFYVHDCILKNDTIWSSEIWAGQFSAIDITNKANPVLLQSQLTPSLFNHNGWFNNAGNVFFTTDEKPSAPLAAYDVSDLQNIKLLDTYLSETAPVGEVHNVRVLNDFLVNANYASHISIVDAQYPDNLVETAHFPMGGGALSWDADPYLPSGVVIATNMSTGFFVFDVNYVRACYLEGNVKDSLTGISLLNAKVFIKSLAKLDSTNLTGDYKTGVADAGLYDVEFSYPGYQTYTATNISLTTGVKTILNVALLPNNFSIPDNSGCNNLRVVYQNALGLLTIDKENCNKTQIGNLQIVDASGRLVYSNIESLDDNKIVLPLSKGVYFYSILNENNELLSNGNFSVLK